MEEELEEGYFKVAFTGEALAEFRNAWPGLPPGDEMIVKIKLGNCEKCGKDMLESKIGGIDPVGITDDGEVVGEFICEDCMKAGR